MSLNIYDKNSKQKILVDGTDEVDSVLSLTSTNPVENKVITQELQDLSSNDSAIVNVLGAKNLLPNNATSQTINGITYTVNSDGTVRANGTATANSYIYLLGNSNATKTFDFPVIGTGCPSDNPNGALRIGFASGYVDTGEGVNIPANTPVSPFVFVTNGTTVNNVVFKPMIRPASIKDDTYVPYAMTNKELTESRKILAKYRNSVACPSTTGDFELCSHTISEDGFYLIIGNVDYSYSSTTEVCIVYVTKNSGGLGTNRTSMASGGGVTGVMVESCSKGDILKLITYAYAGHTDKYIRYNFTVYKLF